MQQQQRILRTGKRGFSVSGAALKYLGWMCMLSGVIALTQFPADDTSALKMVLLLTSYIALPIFALITLEGVTHTSSFRMYCLTTLIAAMIAEPFYDYARFGRWFVFTGEGAQNVLFTILICQVMLYFLRRTEQGKLWGVLLKVLMIVAGLIWGGILQCHYNGVLILFAAAIYLCRNKTFIRTAVLIFLSIYSYFTPVIAIFFINRYDGERGRYNKYLFYVLYPAMWIGVAMMKLFGI